MSTWMDLPKVISVTRIFGGPRLEEEFFSLLLTEEMGINRIIKGITILHLLFS